MKKDKKEAPQGEPIGTELASQSITTKDGRARNFACVVYLDSAPSNWLSIIQEAKIPVLVSPLHKDDINPGGEKKKAHHHVIAMYEGKKSEAQVREFFQSFGGVGLEVINSIRSYARYLCHLDNPEKAQYDVNDVLQYGGADYLTIIDLPTDRLKLIKEMQNWCRDNSCFSYAALMDFAAENRDDWFKVLCETASYVMDKYLKSLKWEVADQRLRELEIRINKIDKETGEILEPDENAAAPDLKTGDSKDEEG